MLIYLRPKMKIRATVVLALVLATLGVRMGLTGEETRQATVGKMAPLTRFETSAPQVGVAVDVGKASAGDVELVLETLAELGWSGTWFVDATLAESNPGLVQGILEKGHEVGLKGTDDLPLDRLSQIEVKDRLTRGRQAFSEIGIEPAPFFYPPLGRYSDTVIAVAFQEGYQAVKPGFDATAMRGAEDKAAAKLVRNLKAGDVILLKCGRDGTIPVRRYLESLSNMLETRELATCPLSALVRSVK